MPIDVIAEVEQARWQYELNGKLITAADEGDLAGVQRALAEGADPHAETDAALNYAGENGHAEVVLYLIKEEGLDPKRRRDNLAYAAVNGHKDVVKILLDHGASPEDELAYFTDPESRGGKKTKAIVEALRNIQHLEKVPGIAQQQIQQVKEKMKNTKIKITP